MTSPVWSVEDQVAWNYIIVADAHIKGSSADIYRYNNSIPVSGLPKLDLISSRTFIGLEPILKSVWDEESSTTDDSHGTPQEENLYEQLLKMIVDWADSLIPDLQRARTPLFFYGTGNVRSVNMFDKHKLMRTACDFFQRESSYLIGDCAKQVTTIHEDLEGILSWLASSYREALPSMGLKATSGNILVGNSGVTSVFIDNEGSKSSMYKASLPLAEGGAEMYDLNVQSDDSLGMGEAWEKYIASGQTSCLFSGSKQHDGKGTGNYVECTKELKNMFGSVGSLPNSITWQASGELPVIHKLVPTIAKAELICGTTWQDLDKSQFPISDLDRLCFKSAYYRDLFEAYFPNNVTPEISYHSGRWTLGRALLYAAEDVCKKSNGPVGVQTNSGSSTWQFAGDVERPLLGDPVDTLDGSSHRLYGAIVFIGLLGAVIYFMMGKRRKNQIFSSLRNKKNDRSISTDDFELPRFQS